MSAYYNYNILCATLPLTEIFLDTLKRRRVIYVYDYEPVFLFAKEGSINSKLEVSVLVTATICTFVNFMDRYTLRRAPVQ